MLARLVAALALVLLATGAGAQQPVDVEIVEYGVYVIESDNTTLRPDGIQSNNVVKVCHVATTTTIPARMNLTFGIRLRVGGSPQAARRQLVMVKHFPVEVTPPGAPRSLRSFSSPFLATPGVRFTGYTFDHAWELLPGTWTFQVFDGNRKLAEQRFTVVEGAPLPTPSTEGEKNCFESPNA